MKKVSGKDSKCPLGNTTYFRETREARGLGQRGRVLTGVSSRMQKARTHFNFHLMPHSRPGPWEAENRMWAKVTLGRVCAGYHSFTTELLTKNCFNTNSLEWDYHQVMRAF